MQPGKVRHVLAPLVQLGERVPSRSVGRSSKKMENWGSIPAVFVALSRKDSIKMAIRLHHGG
jgi:hypothetical protein